jgi:hypothetical protein
MVHVDVIGPLTPRGFNGTSWVIIFTDDHSRARWMYTFATKGEAFAHIVKFVEMVETQYEKKIKIFRLDGGTEYGGAKLIAYLDARGTLLEPTVPYTPEQDGVAERSNRTLSERARTLCEDRGISLDLWPELLQGMIHVINRTATSAVNPLQAFNQDLYGESNLPSVAHLRVLGCTAYVHIQKQRRVASQKFGPRAEEGILVGYEGSSIYRVWIPSRGAIVRSSTVVFDESDEDSEIWAPTDSDTEEDHEQASISSDQLLNNSSADHYDDTETVSNLIQQDLQISHESTGYDELARSTNSAAPAISTRKCSWSCLIAMRKMT